MKSTSGRVACSLLVAAMVVSVAGLSLVPVTADAGPTQAKPKTTKQSASSKRPKTRRYSTRVTSRQSVQNSAARSNRRENGRSATGDRRRDGRRFDGSPATSWRAWNRASAREAPANTGTRQRKTKESQSKRRVHFRPSAGKRS